MAKKALIVLTAYGYWGEELVGPLEARQAAGYEINGRYTADSYTAGQKLIEVLEHGLLRYGW